MEHLPIFLSVKGQYCVVIGGGEIATRKVAQLLRAGAVVQVVSPRLCPNLGKFRDEGRIEHVARTYQPGDVDEAYLAFAATNDERINQQVAEAGLTEAAINPPSPEQASVRLLDENEAVLNGAGDRVALEGVEPEREGGDQADRDRDAGNHSLQRHGGQQHRLRGNRRPPGGDRGGRPPGPRPRVHHRQAAGRIPNPGWSQR